LNRGLPLNEVHVYWGHRSIPALDEEREEAGRRLISAFVWRRLIPLGCVRTGIDDEGRICIARAPRYDAYFGREIGQSDLTPTSELAAKVVIQPDFTVIVIGLNPAPVAELAPFCERTNRGGGQGAMIFKITRESVIKAVSNGLNPEEIATRLERHASNEVPANVLRQVKDWSSWVRQVTSSTRTLIRCPDSDTADRVVAALKSQAERVNDKLVVVNCSMLTAAERSKLKAQGIIVHGPISLGQNWD
jgi:Helicase conserved C-terminal domain